MEKCKFGFASILIVFLYHCSKSSLEGRNFVGGIRMTSKLEVLYFFPPLERGNVANRICTKLKKKNKNKSCFPFNILNSSLQLIILKQLN